MLLGAHVSTAGGIANAIARAEEIDATAIQLFTKMPNRWAERELKPDDVALFRVDRQRVGVGFACAHDSYLINLATADPVLRDRSLASFRAELQRAKTLGLDAIVTHPGNATDGDRVRGLKQNVELIAAALSDVPGSPRILLEGTAGAGSVIGSRFEELARMLASFPAEHLDRVGVCLDTCHLFVAGYDIRESYDAVMEEFDRLVGFEWLRLFHLNDARDPLGSKRDRHAGIGEGTLGDEPFRRIMTDPRFATVPKVIETPKGEDHAATDRANLARLKGYAVEE